MIKDMFMRYKSKNPSLSIITVNYNSGLGLENTVDSIAPFLEILNAELILIDGLSTDDSLSRLAKKKQHYATLISAKDSGIYDAMNKGIKHSKGDWLWFLNSGDLALESCVLVAPYLSSSNHDKNFIYCDFLTNNGYRVNQNFNFKMLLRGMINHQSIFYKKEIIDVFDVSYGLGADFAQLLQRYSQIRHQKLDICVVKYNLNGKSSSFNRYTRVKIWYQRFRAFKDSSLRLDYRLCGMLLSLVVCLAKVFSPKFGSKIIELKSSDIN